MGGEGDSARWCHRRGVRERWGHQGKGRVHAAWPSGGRAGTSGGEKEGGLGRDMAIERDCAIGPQRGRRSGAPERETQRGPREGDGATGGVNRVSVYDGERVSELEEAVLQPVQCGNVVPLSCLPVLC